MSDTAKTPFEKASDAGKAAGQVVGDIAKAAREYLSQSKSAAIKIAHETLSGIEKNWQDLWDKTSPVNDEVKADLQTAKDQITRFLAEAKAELVKARYAGVDAWQRDVKPALDAALHKAQKLYEDASAKVRG
jgi:vacuolar-type H+-ATPase subunit E/Vma4